MQLKRALLILLLAVLAGAARADFVVTNEVDGTFDSTSYDVEPYHLWGDYFATYFYNMYPQYTNHLYHWSESGSGLQGDYQSNEEKWCLPFWAGFAVPGFNWVLASDNGGYTSNQVVQWETNIAAAPGLFYNGTAATNEGFGSLNITHFFPGAIPHDDPSTGYTAAKAWNDASTNVNVILGTAVFDLLDLLWNDGWSTDVSGSRLLGFYSGGHPYPAGHLCMALHTLRAHGVETNVGSMTLDWNNHSVSATNHLVVSGRSLSGNTLSFTVHFDRMPPAWDVPDGTITNDARNAFAVMPDLGSTFQWPLQITNLPVGYYRVAFDGSNVVILSSTQLTAKWNMFTNYNGALWAQRKAVLAAKRDQEGADHVTLLDHGAGSQGTLGVGDAVNFISNANAQYDTNGKRGSTYVSAMATFVSNVQQYDVAIHNAAQQTNHTFTITQIVPRFAPFHK